MSKLMTFLMENPAASIETEELIISSRLKDEKGNLLKAKIKPMTSKEYNRYQKDSTKIGKKGSVSFDSNEYQMNVIINHTVDPDFRDATTISQAGVVTPEQLVNKLLLPGEVNELAKGIQQISGFDDSIDELRDQAKKS
ncbi:hypothetical protein R6Z02_01395 [Carnobacterium maltaromaticum]|uniref:XkdN-like protein n=1 Tax=Carnobacterium maltaromaticum TaxID=2751 RepID=A0AAW9K3D8_CARML|nr:hypothetical protein [Carnobacterium maltaromaticum]MDW5522389.1 hypothetical protein [Carnobacterium maltaromaticum]MDZ5760271.1 hypothetical protein [Carnobacterium maltaromaticum]CAD5898096.1 XkdN-like protein (modular protein) [Carnobacterium maltaromaticum]CAD5900549.1 XkdN-like protein (modular protein) [Carnobacterium maltaromaticum]